MTFGAPLVETMTRQPPTVASYRNALRAHLERALDELFREREPPPGARLMVLSASKRSLTLCSVGARSQGKRPPDDGPAFPETCQREMDRFAAFLKRRFFERGRFMDEWKPRDRAGASARPPRAS